jgi:integrase
LHSHKSRKARRNYVAYLLALNTGMRAGEIWGLKPRDLSLSADGDTIFVRRQFHGIERKFTLLKGARKTGKDKSRHVPCAPILRNELRALIEHNQTGPDEPIFQTPFGNPIHHDCFADLFARDLKKWGGRRIRFHDLRHTAATLMLAKGVDVKTVSEILGH